MLDTEVLRGLVAGEVTAIGGVALGTPEATVRAQLGQPDDADHGWWRYPDLSVRLTDGRVDALRVAVPDLAGRLNLASEQELVGIAGAPATRLGCRNRLTMSFPERSLSVTITLSPFAVEAVLLHQVPLSKRASGMWSFADGHRATVDVVEMRKVYGGLLDGLPTERLNDRVLRGCVAAAERSFPGRPVHLVGPPRTPIDYDGLYPFGTPERLPPVACTARFTSPSCARDMSLDGSVLVIVWFQETMAFPCDSDRFASLPWRELAADVAW